MFSKIFLAAVLGCSQAANYVSFGPSFSSVPNWTTLSPKTPDLSNAISIDPETGTYIELMAAPSNSKFMARRHIGPLEFCGKEGKQKIPGFSKQLFRYEMALRPPSEKQVEKDVRHEIKIKVGGLKPFTQYQCKLYFSTKLFYNPENGDFEDRLFDIYLEPHLVRGHFNPNHMNQTDKPCFAEVPVVISPKAADEGSETTSAMITLRNNPSNPTGTPYISGLACFPAGQERTFAPAEQVVTPPQPIVPNPSSSTTATIPMALSETP